MALIFREQTFGERSSQHKDFELLIAWNAYRQISSGIQTNLTQKSRARTRNRMNPVRNVGNKQRRRPHASDGAASDNKMIQKQVEAKNSDVVQAAAKQRPQHLKPAHRRKFPSLWLANIHPRFKPRRPTYTHPLTLNFPTAVELF